MDKSFRWCNGVVRPDDQHGRIRRKRVKINDHPPPRHQPEEEDQDVIRAWLEAPDEPRDDDHLNHHPMHGTHDNDEDEGGDHKDDDDGDNESVDSGYNDPDLDTLPLGADASNLDQGSDADLSFNVRHCRQQHSGDLIVSSTNMEQTLLGTGKCCTSHGSLLQYLTHSTPDFQAWSEFPAGTLTSTLKTRSGIHRVSERSSVSGSPQRVDHVTPRVSSLLLRRAGQQCVRATAPHTLPPPKRGRDHPGHGDTQPDLIPKNTSHSHLSTEIKVEWMKEREMEETLLCAGCRKKIASHDKLSRVEQEQTALMAATTRDQK